MSREILASKKIDKRVKHIVTGILVAGGMLGCALTTPREPITAEMGEPSQATPPIEVESQYIPDRGVVRVLVHWEQGERLQPYDIASMPGMAAYVNYAVVGRDGTIRVFNVQFDANGNALLTLELFANGGMQHAQTVEESQ